MPNPSNSELARQLTNIQNESRDFRKETRKCFKQVNNRIDPIHDFMVGQKAIMNSKQSTPDSKEQQMWDIIKWALLIIATLLGIRLV